MKALRRAALLTALAASACQAQPAPDAMLEIVTVDGDTLIGLGRQWLVDPRRWPEIARVNRIRNPDLIATGATLRIPLALMRTTALPATVVGVVGDARSAGAPVQPGQILPEGSALATGSNGHLTVRLVDGTLLMLRPDSSARLSESRAVDRTPVRRSRVKLEQGRVEVEAAPSGGRPGFRIETPQGVLAVRGTEFRAAAEAAPPRTRGEVLEGTVAVSGGAGNVQQVAAGFGSVVDSSGGVTPPKPLLPPPDVAALPALHERVLVRMALSQVAGATSYRALVAHDERFQSVVADLVSATPELRFAGLPDGEYVLRVRAVDAQGLEGRDADRRFRLNARPEPPLPAQPRPRSRSAGERVEFAWAASAETSRYALQLAAGEDFSAPLRTLEDLATASTTIEGLAPGVYHWRLRSVAADGELGPWGDAQSFELRPGPPGAPIPSVGDRSLHFAWPGQPGQQFDVEIARDQAFGEKVVAARVQVSEFDLPRPGAGRYWVRLRAIDPDGFVGPYSAPQFFDLPHCLRDSQDGCVRSAGEAVVITVP